MSYSEIFKQGRGDTQVWWKLRDLTSPLVRLDLAQIVRQPLQDQVVVTVAMEIRNEL